MISIKSFIWLWICLALLVAGPVYGQKQGKKSKKQKQQEQATAALVAKQDDPRDKEVSESFFIDGLKYMMLEDYPKALERFQKAYTINPVNAALNYKLAETIMMMGRPNDAVSFAQAAVNLDAANPYYYLLLAQLYNGQQRYDEAIKTLTKLTKDIPNTEQYLFNLADLYLAQKRYDDALKTYDRIEKQYGFIEEIAYKKQQIYLRQNNLDKALKEGETLIAKDPSEARYTLVQAEMLANNKKTEEAISLVNKVLQQEPNNAQARLMLSDLYRQKGNLGESEKNLKLAFGYPSLDVDTKVKILYEYVRQLPVPPSPPNPEIEATALELADMTVKAHPQEAKAHAIAGDVRFLARKKPEALASYLKSIRLDNSHFKIWQQIVFLDDELQQVDSLVTHSEKALELFPNQAMLWLFNGHGYLLKKNPSKGVKSLEYGKKLAADDAGLQAQFNSKLGDAYQSMKEYPKSEAAYESVLTVDPDNAYVLNNYSYYLSLRNQNLTKAKSMSEKLIKQHPKEANYLDTHAWVLYKLKDYAGARKYLEEAIALKKDAELLDHYGDVLYQLGEKDQAVQQWVKAKGLGKETELIDKKIKDKKLYE
jgi:tetratricopeptide (TPR) repeat protein